LSDGSKAVADWESERMMRRQSTWTLALLGGAILALLLLASSISGLSFQPGHFYAINGPQLPALEPGTALPIDPSTIGFWQTVLAGISLVLLICLVIGLILSRKLRRELLRRILMTLAWVLLLNLLISSLRSVPRVADSGPTGQTAPPPSTTVGEPFPTFVAQPAPWLVLAISVLLAALLIGIIWFVWRHSRPQRPALAQIADEAQAALTELQAGGDVANAVLRCYREMSRVISEQRGITRARDMTPREFERQLAALGLRDGHIQQLTRLFERVRYGAGRTGAREEREAIDCLAAIVQTYGAAP
jgi:Domain of unknown function (DUF4129)